MLIFAISSTLVVLSSFFITSLIKQTKNFVDFLLLYFTVFLGQIILIVLSLGIVGQLFTPNIILSEFAIAFVSFYFYYADKAKVVINRPNFDFILNNKILLLAICVFIAFFVSKFWFNLTNPSVCADSLQYHLPFPAAWIQNGNLNNPIVVFGSQPTSAELSALSYYPVNAELFFFWLMFPFRNAFLGDVGQAPFYFIGILAAYSILRKFNLKKETAFLAGMLWALIPNIFKQIRTGSQVDVICAALLLVFLNNLIILARQLNLKNSCILGASLGILVGIKLLNLYWVVALLPLVIYFVYINYRKIGLRNIVLNISAMLLLALLFGGFSYIRTFFITGNPFYPVKIVFLGKEIFPGFIDKEAFSQLFVNWKEFSIKNMFFSEGLGAQFILFVFFGTIVPVLIIPFIRRKYNFNNETVFLSFSPLIMFLMYVYIIKAYWIRYFFPYLGIGIIVAFLFLDKFKWGKKYMTIFGLICIFSSASELAHRYELIFCLIASIVLFFAIYYFRKKIILNCHRLLNPRLLVISVIILFGLLYFLNEKYDREEYSRSVMLFKGNEGGQRDIGIGWKWLNDNTGNGMNVAYTGRAEAYPFYGTKLKNRVFYISTNDKPSMPHYYPDGLYRREKVFESWNKNIKKERIDYLFVALPHKESNESDDKKVFPMEDRWAAGHPELFDLVFSNSLAHIYKVK